MSWTTTKNLIIIGASGTNYDTHNALSTFTSGGGTGIYLLHQNWW